MRDLGAHERQAQEQRAREQPAFVLHDGRGAGGVRERVRVWTRVPLSGDESSLSLELSSSFLRQRFPETTSRNDDDARDEQRNQPEEPEEKSFGERHAERD